MPPALEPFATDYVLDHITGTDNKNYSLNKEVVLGCIDPLDTKYLMACFL